jgi:[protein-PII] uridylyltransferase
MARDDDSNAPAPAPAGPLPMSEIRQRFKQGKAELLDHFREARPTVTSASRLMKALARHVDTTLAQLWHQAALPSQAALIAVGGYGRGELFPYSDVDVLVLLPEAQARDEAVKSAVSDFITACWDVGLEIGSSVRTWPNASPRPRPT